MVITRKLTVRDISNFVYCPIKAYISLYTNIPQKKTNQMILGEILHKAFFIKVKYGPSTLKEQQKYLLSKIPENIHNIALENIKKLHNSLVNLKLPHALIEPTIMSINHQVIGKPDIIVPSEKPIIMEIKFPKTTTPKPSDPDIIQITWYYILFTEYFNYYGPVSLLITYPLQNKIVPINITDSLINYAISTKKRLTETITNLKKFPKVDSKKCMLCEFRTYCYAILKS